jgi:hypothetical protein
LGKPPTLVGIEAFDVFGRCGELVGGKGARCPWHGHFAVGDNASGGDAMQLEKALFKQDKVQKAFFLDGLHQRSA